MKHLQDALKVLRSAEVLSESTLSGVEETFTSLEKTASRGKAVFDHIGLPLIGALGVSAFSGGMGYLLAKRRFGNHTERLKTSLGTISQDPQLSQNLERTRQLFSELTLISPTVASNPRIATKLIQNRLKNGFSLDDVHKLSAIEYHTSNTSLPEEPSSVAAVSAARSFTDQVGRILPGGLRSVSLELEKQEANRIKARDEEKKRQEAQKAQQLAQQRDKRSDMMRGLQELAAKRRAEGWVGGKPPSQGAPSNPSSSNPKDQGDAK